MDKNTTYQLIGILAEKEQTILGHFLNDEQLFLTKYEGKIWVKILSIAPQLSIQLLKIPFEQVFLVGENQYLFPLGKRTPTKKLPQLTWKPIVSFFEIELPVSAEQGKIDDVYFVELEKSSEQKKGNALMTDFQTWKNFVETQAMIRFQSLRFAVSQYQEVLIIGNPLPSIQGKEYWLSENMLLPAGYDFRFPLLTKKIAQKLNPLNDQQLLFFEDGTWIKIPFTDFVKTSRSGVR